MVGAAEVMAADTEAAEAEVIVVDTEEVEVIATAVTGAEVVVGTVVAAAGGAVAGTVGAGPAGFGGRLLAGFGLARDTGQVLGERFLAALVTLTSQGI
jgi:hypothetical protein